MVASSVGLSNHWKKFNENQRDLIQTLSDKKYNLNLKDNVSLSWNIEDFLLHQN